MDILFRGFSKKLNKWIYGYPLAKVSNDISLSNLKYIVPLSCDPNVNEVNGNCLVTALEVENITQYLNLNDKNNNKMFYGDIIQFEFDEDSCWGAVGTYRGYIRNKLGGTEIVYINAPSERIDEDGGIWNVPQENEFYCFVSWTGTENIKVIGNIFENRYLLNEKQCILYALFF